MTTSNIAHCRPHGLKRRNGPFPPFLRCFSPLLLLLLLLPLLSGCGNGETEENRLAYQTYPFTVEGTLSEKDSEETYKIRLQMTSAMTGELSFEQPSSLCGYRFSLSPEGVTLNYGDISLPYKADGLPGGNTLLPRFFSLSKEQLQNSEETTLNSIPVEILTFDTDEGTVTVYLSTETGLPLRLEQQSSDGSAAVIFTVENFSAESGDATSEETSNATSDIASGTVSDPT